MKFKEFFKVEKEGDEVHISGQFSLMNMGKKYKFDKIIGIAIEDIPKGCLAELDLSNGKMKNVK